MSAHSDSDEDEPIVAAASILARAIDRLGNAGASTPMGGLEALGAVILEGLQAVSSSIVRLAEAIENAGGPRH